MQAYNYGSSTHAHATPQGFTPNVSYTAYATGSVPVPAPGATHTPAPSVPGPVQVPPGCFPIELVQFWRGEYKRGQPLPLHWALFVRTATCSSPTHAHARLRRSPPIATTAPATPRGNFYELVGSSDTYTAQFLPHVTYEPETLPDWRGTHVIGWVHPSQLTIFEQVAGQVPVWRQRPDWRCQHWAYEVVRAVGMNYHGVFVDGVTMGGLQKHMGRLLEAWENGDI